jgi:hypothetical protein
MNATAFEVPTKEDHEKALVEVAFLLDMFAATINDLMGGATASISRISGRSMARKLPVYLKNADIHQTIAAMASQFSGGFDISAVPNASCIELNVGKCAIRTVCEARKTPLGGPLCKLFHYYLDGVVNDLYQRPVKSTLGATGNSCTAKLISK